MGGGRPGWSLAVAWEAFLEMTGASSVMAAQQFCALRRSTRALVLRVLQPCLAPTAPAWVQHLLHAAWVQHLLHAGSWDRDERCAEGQLVGVSCSQCMSI